MNDLTFGIVHQSAVGTILLGTIEGDRMSTIIEGDGVPRVSDQIRMIGETIGNVGVGEDRMVEPSIEPTGLDLS